MTSEPFSQRRQNGFKTTNKHFLNPKNAYLS
jgi:hypothetical protein